MSSYVYPSSTDLPGLTWNRERSYLWATEIQEAVSGKETRLRYRQYPRLRFTLKYELLRDNITTSEVKKLVSFFNAHAGAHDTFLFQDPDFNSITNYNFATTDGTAASYQLTGRYQPSSVSWSSPEIIQNLNGAITLTKGGVSQTLGTDYTLSPTGVVTFTSTPAAGLFLRWTGNFYYRCRFEDDEMTVTQFLQSWWASKEINLISVKL